jgi:DNA-binding transcriptional MerR regulator
MKVIELARAAGVSPDTVRHYTRGGLLRPERNPDNGYQRYDSADLRRLRFVRRARELGFSLGEAAEILRQADLHQSPCPLVRDLFTARLAEVEQRLLALTALRDRMRSALDHWRQMPDGVPDGHTICQLIENWNQPEEGCRDGH